jgi:uncharacterized membrane protein YphA (DoxX/SURF4 family)
MRESTPKMPTAQARRQGQRLAVGNRDDVGNPTLDSSAAIDCDQERRAFSLGPRAALTSSQEAHMFTKYGPGLARLVFGFVFLVFGLNGFLNFMPMPPPPPQAGAFMGALAVTGYMFPLIKGIEVIVGVLLLSNRFVPLALVLIAPNVVNIVLFHAFLVPAGLPLAFFVLTLELYLAWTYRASYRALLQARTSLETVERGSKLDVATT